MNNPTPTKYRMKFYEGRPAIFGPPHPDGGDYAPLCRFGYGKAEECHALFLTEAGNAYEANQSELVALRTAAEANLAWNLAEELNLGSFQARMELCSYSQWLTRQALGANAEYKGVPRIVLDLETVEARLVRCDVEGCKALVREVLERAALKLSEPEKVQDDTQMEPNFKQAPQI